VLKSGTLSSTTTFDSATVTLSGTVNVGDVWSLTLTDSSAHTSSYTWTGNETGVTTNADKLEYIANQLGSSSGALSGFAPDISGAASVGVSVGSPANAFKVSFAKNGITSDGSISVSGHLIDAGTAQWTALSFALAGTPSSYEDWTVTLNDGTAHVYTHHVALGGASASTPVTVDVIGADLAAKIHADYLANTIEQDATYTGGVLSISAPSGLRADSFTAQATVTAGAQGSVTASALARTHGVAMPASPTVGETWLVTVVDTSGTNAVVASGTASASSSAALATALAAELNNSANANKLPAGYLATASGGNVVVSNAAGKSFEIGLTKQQAVESHGQTLTEAVAAGQVWAVKVLESTTVVATASYVAASGDSKHFIASKLAEGLNSAGANGLPAGYVAVVAGDSVIVNKASNSGSSFSVAVAARQSSDISTATTADVLTLTGAAAVGSYWDVQLIDTDANILRDVVNYRVATSGMQPSDIVAAVLPTLSSAGYTIVQDGARFVAVNTAGTNFDLKLSASTRTSEVGATTPVTTAWDSTVTVNITGGFSSIQAGSTWRIELSAGGSYVATSTYTWLGTETASTAAAAEKVVAAGLAANLNAAGYTVNYTAGNNSFVVDGTAAFTVATSGFTFGTSSTPVSTDAVTVASTATTAGDIWGIKLAQTGASVASTTADYIAETNATTSAIVDALISDLGTAPNALPTGVGVTKVGNTIVAYTTTSGATVTFSAAPVATGYSTASVQSVGIASPTAATGVTVLTGATSASVTSTAYPGTLAGLVTQLNTNLSAGGFGASTDGTYLFINREGSTAFNAWTTSAFSVTSTAVTLAAGAGGAGVTGETWTVGVTGESATGTYTTTQASPTVAKTPTEIADGLATNFDGALASDYVVVGIGDKVVIARISGTVGTASGTYTAPTVPVGNTQTVKDGTGVLTWDHILTYGRFAENASIPGDTWKLNVAGVSGASTAYAQAASTTIADVRAHFNALLAPTYVVTNDGSDPSKVHINKADGGEVTIGAATQTRFAPSDDSPGASGPTHYATATVTLDNSKAPAAARCTRCSTSTMQASAAASRACGCPNSSTTRHTTTTSGPGS
ncbi:MAG TPA: hypothetical protein VN716_18645, partial [Vicinamibacterales bacterium]|nr:hypothetical protein [Vicinamibacterales bacterium]